MVSIEVFISQSKAPWNRNIHYHGVVLDAVPAGCRRALDAGCGRGWLARDLAPRCGEVVAIDADRDTLARARAATAADRRITFVDGDVMTYPFEPGSFDLVAAIAMLHHVPLDAGLARLRHLLRPGGVLAIIGLHALRPLDYTQALAAIPVTLAYRLAYGFTEVGAPIKDPVETIGEIRAACAAALPGAVFRRHLLFRYSIVWRKPVRE